MQRLQVRAPDGQLSQTHVTDAGALVNLYMFQSWSNRFRHCLDARVANLCTQRSAGQAGVNEAGQQP
jgi:hypothetical protein